MMMIEKINNYILFSICFFGSYLHSLISSLLIMHSKQRFSRNCLHIPFGHIGGIISNYDINHGYIYFMLLMCYQILETVENISHSKHDYSFYDIEGYVIGFSSNIFFFYLKDLKKQKYELTNV